MNNNVNHFKLVTFNSKDIQKRPSSIRKVDESENLLNQKIQNVLWAKTGKGMNKPP